MAFKLCLKSDSLSTFYPRSGVFFCTYPGLLESSNIRSPVISVPLLGCFPCEYKIIHVAVGYSVTLKQADPFRHRSYAPVSQRLRSFVTTDDFFRPSLGLIHCISPPADSAGASDNLDGHGRQSGVTQLLTHRRRLGKNADLFRSCLPVILTNINPAEGNAYPLGYWYSRSTATRHTPRLRTEVVSGGLRMASVNTSCPLTLPNRSHPAMSLNSWRLRNAVRFKAHHEKALSSKHALSRKERIPTP